MDSDTKIARSVAGVSVSTLASRILGYVRDMLIANFFGAGLVADSFFVAYRIPNLLRQLLGEGALSASFIPVFSEYLTTESREEAEKLARLCGVLLFSILGILTVLGIVFSPLVVRVVAPGFVSNPEKFSLTVTLTRILFPFMLAIGLAALALGILNSLHRFIIPALAPCFLSISEIFFVLAICPLMSRPIIGLAIGVVVGGFGQLFFQVPAIVKEGFFRWRKKSCGKSVEGNRNEFLAELTSFLNHPGVRKIGMLMIPATLGLSIAQVNMFVDTICASLLKEGSVTALYYANRVVQLPLALFGTAIATVSLPLMSKAVASNNISVLKDTLSLAIRMILFAIIPCMAGLIVLGRPIISLLFERGRFTAEATQMTNWALLFYSTGIVAYAGVKVIASVFYSMQDTGTPVKIASAAMVANIILNIVLMHFLDVGGLALATAVASFINLSLLLHYLRKRIGRIGGKKILHSLSKITISTTAMTLVCILSGRYLRLAGNVARVLGSISICVLVYVLASYFLKCEETKYLMKMVSRRESTDEI